MILDFLREHIGQRVRAYAQQPQLIVDESDMSEGKSDAIDRDYEVIAAKWQPRDIQAAPKAGTIHRSALLMGKT